jgi:hypothetical protein
MVEAIKHSTPPFAIHSNLAAARRKCGMKLPQMALCRKHRE